MTNTPTQIRTGSMRALVITTGVATSLTFWLVVATYPSFFMFNPFENENPWRAGLLTALVAAWVALATAPVVLFCYFAIGHRWPMRVLPYVAAGWPALLLINHVSLAIVEGQWYTGYLLDYPIFFITDALLPAFLLAIWFEVRPLNHPIREAVGRHRL